MITFDTPQYIDTKRCAYTVLSSRLRFLVSIFCSSDPVALDRCQSWFEPEYRPELSRQYDYAHGQSDSIERVTHKWSPKLAFLCATSSGTSCCQTDARYSTCHSFTVLSSVLASVFPSGENATE